MKRKKRSLHGRATLDSGRYNKALLKINDKEDMLLAYPLFLWGRTYILYYSNIYVAFSFHPKYD